MIKKFKIISSSLFVLLVSLTSFGCSPSISNLSEKDIKSRLIKKHPIENSWIKLRTMNYFPTKEDEAKGNYFHLPSDLAVGTDGSIFVSDCNLHQILKFDANGKYIKSIGQKGDGPGEFICPRKIRVTSDNSLFVLEGGKPRIQVIDGEGNYLREFKIFYSINDFIVSDGFIYANCSYPEDEQKTNPLVVKFDTYGKIIGSFGKRIDRPGNFSEDSKVFLALSNNEIIAVFKHYPLVVRHTLEGTTLREIRMDIPIFRELEKYNYKKKYTNPAPNIVRLPRLTAGVKVVDKSIFVLAHLPRLEIIEMDMEGNIKNWYYSEELKNVINLVGFEVRKKKGIEDLRERLLFYVLQSSEEAKLYVFTPE